MAPCDYLSDLQYVNNFSDIQVVNSAQSCKDVFNATYKSNETDTAPRHSDELWPESENITQSKPPKNHDGFIDSLSVITTIIYLFMIKFK